MRANVRCCCDPGLVLGTLPVYGYPKPNGSYRFAVLSVPRAGEEQIGVGRMRFRLRYAALPGGHKELAYDSNHGTPEDLARIAEFQPYCLLPGEYSDEDTL